jgi:tetratricopeptide (TPR) repeat protein
LGIASCLDWADEIEKEPLHEVNAWRIRMYYQLRQGDVEKAEKCKRMIEMLQIRNSPSQFYEGGTLYPELMVFVFIEDLVRVKELIDDVQGMAERFPAWVPILHYARGEYQRIRGDYSAALREYDKALALMKPGRHLNWVHAIGGYVGTLYQLGCYQDAKAIGEQALLDAERVGIQIEVGQIKKPLALILAKLGQTDEAIRHCESVIGDLHLLKATGINLGIAYETRARVAILMNDQKNFQSYSRLCAEQYRAGHNPVLTAKYERLLQSAREAGMNTPKELENAALFTASRQAENDLVLDIRKRLACSRREDELFQKALGLIVEHTKSRWGFLYLFEQNHLLLVAQSTNIEPPPELLQDLSAIVDRCIGEESETQTEQSEMTVRPTFLQGDVSPEKSLEPILLSLEIDGTFTVVGVAVVSRKLDMPFQANYGIYEAVAGGLYDARHRHFDVPEAASGF